MRPEPRAPSRCSSAKQRVSDIGAERTRAAALAFSCQSSCRVPYSVYCSGSVWLHDSLPSRGSAARVAVARSPRHNCTRQP